MLLAGKKAARKSRTNLTESQQAQLLLEYSQLRARGSARGSVAQLAAKFKVNPDLPGRLFQRAKTGQKAPASRSKVGGRPPKIGQDEAQMIEDVLRAHGWDMSYRELQEATGISRSVLQRWFNAEVQAGRWRVVGKGYRPHLTDGHRDARLKFAKDCEKNKWHRHVDIDEKWFYATSLRRKLKLPDGVKRPTMPVKSKRFIPKVMVLTAIARPCSKHKFDGKVGCWRVCEQQKAIRNSPDGVRE